MDLKTFLEHEKAGKYKNCIDGFVHLQQDMKLLCDSADAKTAQKIVQLICRKRSGYAHISEIAQCLIVLSKKVLFSEEYMKYLLGESISENLDIDLFILNQMNFNWKPTDPFLIHRILEHGKFKDLDNLIKHNVVFDDNNMKIIYQLVINKFVNVSLTDFVKIYPPTHVYVHYGIPLYGSMILYKKLDRLNEFVKTGYELSRHDIEWLAESYCNDNYVLFKENMYLKYGLIMEKIEEIVKNDALFCETFKHPFVVYQVSLLILELLNKYNKVNANVLYNFDYDEYIKRLFLDGRINDITVKTIEYICSHGNPKTFEYVYEKLQMCNQQCLINAFKRYAVNNGMLYKNVIMSLINMKLIPCKKCIMETNYQINIIELAVEYGFKLTLDIVYEYALHKKPLPIGFIKNNGIEFNLEFYKMMFKAYENNVYSDEDYLPEVFMNIRCKVYNKSIDEAIIIKEFREFNIGDMMEYCIAIINGRYKIIEYLEKERDMEITTEVIANINDRKIRMELFDKLLKKQCKITM